VAAPPAAPKSFLQRRGPALLVSLCLGGGLAWVLARGGLPVVPDLSAFAGVRPWAVAGYVVSLAIVHFFRAARWRHLLRPLADVPLRRVVAVSWIAFAAILLSPFRTGEVVRPYLLASRSRVRLWEAAGTVGAERVVDGLVLSLFLLAGLLAGTPVSPLPDHVGELPVPAAAVRPAAYLALALFTTAFVAMGVFYARRDTAQRWTSAVIGFFSPRLADKLAGIAIRLADGLRFLPSRRLVVPFLSETLVYWAVNALGVWLLAWGTGLTGMSLADATVVMGCIGIGILVPSGPGYFGAFQLAAFMALATTVPAAQIQGPGGAFVFLLYVSQTGFHILAAIVGLAMDPVLEAETASLAGAGSPPLRHAVLEAETATLAGVGSTPLHHVIPGAETAALAAAGSTAVDPSAPVDHEGSTRSEPRTTP